MFLHKRECYQYADSFEKAYGPMRNKRISLDNANKLSQIFNRFDANKEMMKQLYKASIYLLYLLWPLQDLSVSIE